MMRRRLCVSAGAASSQAPIIAAQVRFQGSGRRGNSNNNNSSNNSNNRQSGLHTFIRDNAAAAPHRPTSGGGAPRSGGQRPTASSPVAGGDWAAQMQQELLRDEDPLGGMAHKDYYRDPAAGYSPQYAPRNFSLGGSVAYTHPQSSQHYSSAAAQRQWTDHDVSRYQEDARASRATSRSLPTPTEREAFLQSHVPSDRFASHIPESASVSLLDQVNHSTVTSGDKYRQQTIVNRHQHAAAEMAAPTPMSAVSGMSADELRTHFADEVRFASDNATDESLRIAYGLREKEKWDFTVMQRNNWLNFEGYDMDRFSAQQKGKPYGAQQIPPNTPSSSILEAQTALRGSASVPTVESHAQREFSRNTVTDSPKLGEELTATVVEGLRAGREMRREEKDAERRKRFGIGRQGSLVQDAGPDRRTVKKHANDERLMYADAFSANAYRKTKTDEHVNPYERGNTQHGVGHLLNNRFDIDRREGRIGKGEEDLTERRTMHLGVPITQSVDEFVLRRRNARGERPIDYYKPFPDFRSNRLSRMYQDTEGFPLMKQRPDFLEWEMFVRYRAHHQQRRELALLHGLEPVANETAQERDARRAKLDQLCESTPFDASRIKLKDEEVAVDVETLRNWFGVYFLPSPTIVELVTSSSSTLGLHLQHRNDELGTADTREHLLSGRYLNKLLLSEGYQHRVGRGFVSDVIGKAKEPVIRHAQPPEVLKHFSAEEMAMYNEYVASETSRQLAEWESTSRRRRFIVPKQQYGEVVSTSAQQLPVSVVDVQGQECGTVFTISVDKFTEEIAAANANASTAIVVDGKPCTLLPSTERRVLPLTVKMESGELMETTDEEFESYPLEHDASGAQQHALNYGVSDYHYNRGNYVETQDVLWEKATAAGVEGWSPATHVDGLRPGLPVRARRALHSEQDAPSSSSDRIVAGDYQRGRIAEYLHQPFFNPEPRLVSVAFGETVEQIPLADILIWQRQYYGPDRTTGDESRRYNGTGVRRYVDVTDPNNERTQTEPHFLDKYEIRHTADAQRAKYRSMKQITEIDAWSRYDTRRPENHRPLSISHRKDYIRQGYVHRYTPWEWIAVQEADQPIIAETMRQDNTGSSHFFSLNRYWRYKARPHGYLRNFENEVRDLFQYVDGVTPWKQAQKIRTYWEVRQHHPMPQFNRPEVAMHRNTAGLLPAHLWETDKKTGKVKGVKESVRDYQTKTPLPKWVQM